MNKINFLKLLKKNNIKFLLLSDDIFNKNKDLDLYINLNNKKKLEKLIYKKNFFKRKKEVLGHPNRFFYYNELNKSKLILDISFKVIFFKNDFFYYQLKEPFLNECNENLLFIIKIARMFFYKKKNLKSINSFIFNKKNSYLRKKFEISKKFENFISLKKFILPFFVINFKFKFFEKFKFKSNYILFLGSDGSGKTTLANELKNQLVSKVYFISFGTSEKYWLSKILFLLAGKYEKNKKIYCIFFFIDILLRRIKLFLFSNHHFIFIDRFPGFIFNSNFKSKIFSIVLTRPNLIFLLKTQKKIIKERKPLEFKNDYLKWVNIGKILGISPFIIDTSKLSIPKTVLKIKKIIFSKKKFFYNILEN